MAESLIGFAVLLTLILVLRVPIAFALGLVGFGGYWIIQGWIPALSLASQHFTDTVMNYSLSVVPMFILMGNLVSKAGLSHELYRASHAFLGHRRGGLAMATIVACGGFSAICGSSLATAATMSKVALPPMREYGYRDSLATASIASGGTLGILIPPSVILVIYGFLTETSIRDLFAAGFLPGLLGVVLYLMAVRFVVWRDPKAGPAVARIPWPQRMAALANVWATLILFVIVIGGIYIGLFTPEEAAGVGAVGAFAIATLRRAIDWRSFLEILIDTVRTTAVLFAILMGAVLFTEFVNRAGLPEALKGFVTGNDVPAIVVVLIIIAIYIVLGCVFESLSMLLLTIPVFFPIVQSLSGEFGLTPAETAVWFGIIAVVVTEISLITPPVGLNVFVLSSVLPDVRTGTIFRGVTPFWVVDIIRLALLLLIPSIAIVLPNSLFHCDADKGWFYKQVCPAREAAAPSLKQQTPSRAVVLDGQARPVELTWANYARKSVGDGKSQP